MLKEIYVDIWFLVNYLFIYFIFFFITFTYF